MTVEDRQSIFQDKFYQWCETEKHVNPIYDVQPELLNSLLDEFVATNTQFIKSIYRKGNQQ